MVMVIKMMAIVIDDDDHDGDVNFIDINFIDVDIRY